MNKLKQFQTNKFFNAEDMTELKLLFNKTTYIWELIQHIPDFIATQIKPAILGTVEEGAWLEPNNVYIAPGALVERGAIVKGPCIIGPGSTVRSNAYIRGHVMTGSHCMIGAGTEVRNTIMMNNSNIPHQNLVFSSFIGNNVNVAGQTTLANKRLDGKEIFIHISDENKVTHHSTGADRFGAIIGDNCRIGAMCVIQPGTIIGKDCFIYPTSAIGGCIPDNSIIKVKDGHCCK